MEIKQLPATPTQPFSAHFNMVSRFIIQNFSSTNYLHTHALIFSRLSIATVDGKQHLSEVFGLKKDENREWGSPNRARKETFYQPSSLADDVTNLTKNLQGLYFNELN